MKSPFSFFRSILRDSSKTALGVFGGFLLVGVIGGAYASFNGIPAVPQETNFDSGKIILSQDIKSLANNVREARTELENFSFLEGNVGIGTTTPNAELDVEGTLKVNNPNATYGNNTTGNLGNVIIGSEGKIHDMAGYYMALSHNIDWDETNGFKYINAGPAARIELGGWTSTGESHIAFEVPPTSSGPSIIGGMDPEHRKMVIKSNGAVGIGTTTPKSRLSVNGDIDVFQSDKFAKIMLDSGSSTKTLSIHYGTDPDSVDATNQLRFGRYGDNLGAWEATPVRFDMDAPNGSLLLSDSGNLLVNNGNMGIGIVSPQAKLDVGGEGYFGSTNKLKIQENNGGLSVQGTLATDDSQKKNIFLNAWGGNVGIGTTAPQAKLDVNGKIKSQSTVATDSGTTLATKDYVDNKTLAPTLTCTSVSDISGGSQTNKTATCPSGYKITGCWNEEDGGSTPSINHTTNECKCIMPSDITGSYCWSAVATCCKIN